MTKHIFIFLGTFMLGAIIALGARTATHKPAATPPAAVDPHAGHQAAPADPHAGHGASEISNPKSQVPAASAAGAPAAGKPVNTHCAICGMPVDPTLPTVTYQGQTIGFGCKMCPPKFAAEPDKYGPIYLRNEIIKN